MTDLTILHPLKDTLPPLKFGETLGVVVDVVLDAPWLELPNPGKRLQDLDGEQDVALSFETRFSAPVKALAAGRAETRDTGRDDHSGPPLRKGNAGRGLEVIVRTGTYFEISYSHLKRGTARVGLVKRGEAVGHSGNSGRCVDGAKSAFVKIAARNRGSPVRLEDLLEPIVVDATWNGAPICGARELEAGALEHKKFALERVLIESGRLDAAKEEIFRSGENELVVCVKRGSRVLARRQETLVLEW